MRLHPNTPLVLIILDGWGYDTQNKYNAIAEASTPQWDEWWRTHPHILLEASGEAVGLPPGQMGNSEVGHMHIGAGQLIQQDYTRINEAINADELIHNPILCAALAKLTQNNKALHLIGLCSQGGVHSHEDHLFAILEVCRRLHFNRVYLHLFLDGRDTPPQSAMDSLTRLSSYLAQYPIATICSITGRYYAMDRDNRWERIEPVYHLLTQAESTHQFFEDAPAALNYYYQHNITDEFLPPTLIGAQSHPIEDGDAVFFFNFRADRARQLTTAFIADEFIHFERVKKPNISFLTMTPYADYLATESVFPRKPIQDTLGQVIAAHGLRQLRIAETEKYAHVTFFFNGGSEKKFKGEERILIPSPPVATYDLKPEMSAPELTRTVVDAIEKQGYDVIICNYANADMVGHSGNFAATVKAIEYLDNAMQTIAQALQRVGGQLLITADHGNAERMYDTEIQQPHTAHTNQPVPLLYVGPPQWQFNVAKGSLTDIAPTILRLLGLPIPTAMIGQGLLVKHDAT